MGKNNGNSWLNAVKRAFKSPSKDNDKSNNKRREQNEQQQEEKKRGNRKWIFGKHFPIETTIQHKVAKTAISLCSTSGQENMVAKPKPKPKMENISSLSHQKQRATSLLIKQHEAAVVVIQTIFRGYLARRALLALKGVVKMQALIRGHNVRKRAKMTLQCIQSLVRVQALVCDQRINSKNACNTSNSLDLEEIQTLIQKAKQCSLKQGKALARILSHEAWTVDEDQDPDNNYQDLHQKQEHKCPDTKLTIHPTVRKDRSLCINQKDPIRTVEMDTSYQTAETPTSRAIYLHRMSQLSENSCPLPRPNYMAATQSAMARVRSHSTPRQRPSSPIRHQTGSAIRKRLSFPIPDEQRSNAPYYLTE